MPPLTIKRFSGDAVLPFLPDLARLRIAVFREYPYLYDGSQAYEESYLKAYAEAADGVIVTAWDGDRVVGVSTGLPLEAADADFRAPFEADGRDVSRVFYFGESVLDAAYRGHGMGRRFFEEREAHARSVGRFDLTAFCAVQRPADHPRRPSDYRPLDAFWERLGYVRHPELVASVPWKELDEREESPKPLVFWLKPLAAH